MPRTILIAEPSPDTASILRAELHEGEFLLETVCLGSEALARLHAAPVSLLISTLHLRDTDGIELLREAREAQPNLSVILIADSASRLDVIAALREHAFAVFLKPVAAQTLLDMVREGASCETCEHDIELVSAVPHWVSIRVVCKLQAADRAVQFLREIDSDIPIEDREEASTALRELIMNAVEHGGNSDPDLHIEVTRLRTPTFVGYFIRDPGEGFSFDDLGHAAVSNPPDSAVNHLVVREEQGMRPGGFGITMARNLLDGLFYNEKGNEVVLIKNLRKR